MFYKSCFAAFVLALLAVMPAPAQTPKQKDNGMASVASVPCVYVRGAVAFPGIYIYKTGDRVLDALRAVKGLTPQANIEKVNVIHTDEANGVTKTVVVNLSNFMLRGSMSDNPLLHLGDQIFVSKKRDTPRKPSRLGDWPPFRVLGVLGR